MRSALIALVGAAFLSIAPRHAPAEQGPEPKLRLYAFFATWCVPCRVELPHLQELADNYRKRGLEVVLVSQDAPSTAANIPAFLARYGVSERWVLDSESQLAARFNQTASLPFTALVRADGSLVYSRSGYEPGDEELLEAAINEYLEAPETKGLELRVNWQSLGVYRQSRFDPVVENDGLLRAGVTRLEASAYVEGFSAQARVDGAAIDDEVGGEEDDARLERLRIRESFGPLTLTGGDDYASIGNGLTLSLRKVDPLGLDTTLRGGKARLEIDHLVATAVAGVTNPQNLDPLNLRVLKPSRDFVAAGEVTLKNGSAAIAPYGLVAVSEGAGAGGEDAEWMVAGVSGSIAAGPVRLALEAAGGRREGIALVRETPLAAYGSLHASAGRHSALFEFKAYRDWLIGRPGDGLLYHEPPTLEREDQEVPANDNALGGRGRYTVTLGSELSGFANILHYRYAADGTSATNGSDATHAYGGASGTAGELAWSGQAGYRRERDSDGDFKLSLWHLDADVSRPIASAWGRTVAATFKWNHRDEQKQLLTRFSFRRGLAVVGLSLAGVGAISALYGYSTERRNGTAPTHYPGAELALQLPRGGIVKLFAGRLTGGRVCVSGSCRDVPPFDGGRLDVVIRW